MFEKPKISIVNQEEKYEKAKLVEPNMIWNRLDIKYSGSFDVLKVKYKHKIQYITYHISKKNALYVGIYMMELEQKVFDEILRFFKVKYPNLSYVHITQGIIKHPELERKMHWLLNLPDTVDDYWAQFSSGTRKIRKKRLKKLQENYNVKFEHIKKSEIDGDLIERFFTLKLLTEDNICYKTDNKGVKAMLSDVYNITDAYIIKINGQIEAIQLCSTTNDKDAYFINLTYNTDFSRYGLGMMAYYYAIEQFIERKFKRIYIGGGDYDYKKESKAVKTETMSGNIKNIKLEAHNNPLKILFECTNENNHKVVKILGLKFKFKIKASKFSRYELLRKYFIKANIKGSNNKIQAFYNNRWHNLKLKSPDSRFWIKGKNNKIRFHFDTRTLPKGLDMTVNGSYNVVDIYKSSFKNTYIQIYRDKNTLNIKEQTSQTIAGAHIYVSYGGSMFIGEDCELGNGGLELAVAGDYKEKHKMVIGDNTHIARDTIIRTSDGQSLIDPETGIPIDPPQDVIIGNHVWIMSRCIILKGTVLPDGCAVAANSLVNKKFEQENLLLCGTPARIMRENIRWGAPYGKVMERLEKEKKEQLLSSPKIEQSQQENITKSETNAFQAEEINETVSV